MSSLCLGPPLLLRHAAGELNLVTNFVWQHGQGYGAKARTRCRRKLYLPAIHNKHSLPTGQKLFLQTIILALETSFKACNKQVSLR